MSEAASDPAALRIARVPTAASVADLRERGSVFLARIEPVSDPEEARRRVQEIAAAHRDATHVCWAWRLLDPSSARSSDAGEPAGTAGVPIARVLEGASLHDVLAVVVRWYGGTKLGKGGLARAYAAVTRLAIEGLEVEERRPSCRLAIRVGYSGVGVVERLLRPPAVVLESRELGLEATFVVRVWRERRAAVEEVLAEIGGRVEELGRGGS